jgi:Tol biopolymer transport system component
MRLAPFVVLSTGLPCMLALAGCYARAQPGPHRATGAGTGTSQGASPRSAGPAVSAESGPISAAGRLTWVSDGALVSVRPEPGAPVNRILSGGVEEYAWSRDGSAVACTMEGARGTLFVSDVSPKGVAGPGVAVAAESDDGLPTCSPDGRSVVYTASGNWQRPSPGRGSSYSELRRVVRTHGHGGSWSAPQPIGPPVTHPDLSSYRPSYSPNGNLIAFVRDRAPWLMGADGSSPHEIGPGGVWVEDFSWFPDSSALAVTGSQADSVKRVWRVPIDGTAPNSMVSDAGSGVGWARVSPHGRQVVYLQGSPERETDGGDEVARLVPPVLLWVAHADGSDARVLVARGECDVACWSPDGMVVACPVMDLADGSTVLVLVEVATGRTCEILRMPSYIRGLEWRP